MRNNLNDLTIAARGFLMGAADAVPGVSGGTVALIVGVYERLLAAISCFDAQLLRLLAERKWAAAAEHLDLRFLTTIGTGIIVGYVGLAGVMHHLLEHHLSLTFAAFFGLILASGILVGQMCRPARGRRVMALGVGVVAMLAAVWIVSRPLTEGGDGVVYTFACGAIAICAMILPGVSGSYLLVLLGMYEPITSIVKRLPRLDVSGADVVTLAIFAAGCAVGLLAFSRLLKWLLKRAWTPTMAALCGFMIGSLYKVWPFQAVDESHLTSDAPLELKEKLAAMRPVLPESMDGHAWACLGVAVGSLVLVLVADRVAKQIATSPAAIRPTES